MSLQRVTRLPGRDDDRGAYAILFAVLVVVLVGVVAFVLDLALVRESRAANRSISDSAVVAAAGSLQDASGRWTPARACTAAWSIIGPKIPGSGTGPATCGTTWTDPVATCPATGTPATWTGGDYSVVITWPVPRFLADGVTPNPLLDLPDTLPARPSQGFDADQDGTDAGCDRIAVQVFQDNKLGLSGIFGVSSVTASASSVARSVISGFQGDLIAALNILETTGCEAITTDGTSKITVGITDAQAASEGADPRPGIIGVDSSGTTGCGGNKKVISPSNATNTGIYAVGSGAMLQSYAVQLQGGTITTAYEPGRLGTSEATPGNLWPRPTALSQPVGRVPIDQLYNCTSDTCSPGGGNYIATLAPWAALTRAQVDAQNVSTPGTWRVITTCNLTTDTDVTEANVYFDVAGCPGGTGITIRATLTMPNATTIVSNGGVNVGGSGSGTGCLVVNVGSTCPTGIAAVANDATKDAVFVVQRADFTKNSGSSIYLRNTLTYITAGSNKGFTNFQGGGSGNLLLTNPEGLACGPGGTPSCKYSHFWKLTLWAEKATTGSNDQFKFSGGAGLKLRGVLFTPNGDTNLVGQSSTEQNRAQFWTRNLRVTGGAQVVMDVDPSASVARPAYTGALIR